MKKYCVVLVLLCTVLLCAVLLCACDGDGEKVRISFKPTEPPCAHVWSEATCLSAKQCTLCGKKNGQPLSHAYKEATCVQPKTCVDCGHTEGKTTGHSYAAATCTAPETCVHCGCTRGTRLEHSYHNLICVSCGAQHANYAKVRQALVDCVRYINYLEFERVSIEYQVSMYRSYGGLSYLSGMANDTADAIKYIREVLVLCQPYSDLKLLYDSCVNLLNVDLAGTNAFTGTVKLANHTANSAKDVRATYLAVCELYNIVITVSEESENQSVEELEIN